MEGLLFFPVPKNQIARDKRTKRIQFIDLDGLQRLLSGEKIDAILGQVRTIPLEGETLWQSENIPRIGLNRLTNHPGEAFFHFGQVTYNKDAGLFLIVDIKDSGIQKQFFSCFNLLAHEGIGGDRSSGKGLFEKPELSYLEIETAPNLDAVYSLSLYYPQNEERTDFDHGFYELIERKGYIYSPFGQSLRRRSIRTFAEGSVFRNIVKRLGCLVDVTPGGFRYHRVYRYGLMLSFPCKLEVA